MGSLTLLHSLKESILGQASVKSVYGEPITAHDKTIIPVAKILYGYGAGAGSGRTGEGNSSGEGSGGGGGLKEVPVGVIEVTSQHTRFIAISDKWKLTGAVLAGIGLTLLWGRYKNR